jgi:CIC family chloride channel protein
MRALSPPVSPWWQRFAGLVAGIEVPQRLRAIVRARESSLIILAAGVGAVAGVVIAIMGHGVDLLHQLFFLLAPGQRLSGLVALAPLLAITVPTLGGLALGIATQLIAARRPAREVDPIEANALHGGRMSLLGSLIVAAQTVWSSGVGASVGLEAGYTQLSSGIASRLGGAFRLRRADLRILVGCGSAGGIAGAFGAPLAGAFYAFELVIGNYSVKSLAPVGISAVIGYLVARGLAPIEPAIIAPQPATVANQDLVVAALLGLMMAVLGIALMRGVALGETLFVRLKLNPVMRCAIGGFAVGLMAIVTPQVMRRAMARCTSPACSISRSGRSQPSSFSNHWPPSSRLRQGFAAACSFRRCCSGRWPAACSRPH